MTWESIAGRWHHLKGQAKQTWGQLTDDDLEMIQGRREELIGRLQERYGLSRDDAERQVRAWERTVR